MAVSLYDVLRLTALATGLDFACRAAGARGAGIMGYASVISGGLIAGAGAVWISQVIAHRLSAKPPSEGALVLLYATVFFGIALASFGGGLFLLAAGSLL